MASAKQKCAMELEVANFQAVSQEFVGLVLRARSPKTRVSNRTNICEISSSPVMVIGACRFGLVLSWQMKDDGSAKPDSNIAVSIWRDGAEERAISVHAVVEIANQNYGAASLMREENLKNLKQGKFDGWWFNDVTVSDLVNPAKGWMHDDCSLRVSCELTIELKDVHKCIFNVGDRVQVKASVRTPRYGWGEVSRATPPGTVLEMESDTKMYIDYPGVLNRWSASISEMELVESSSKTVGEVETDPQKLAVAASMAVFRDLFSSGSLSDVTVQTSGGDIDTHAVVLAAGSPVFRSMLTTSMKEGTSRRIDLRHLSALAVRELISFIYTHQLEPLVLENEELIWELLHLASYFGLPFLAKKCLDVSGSALRVDTVFARLGLDDLLTDADTQEHYASYRAQCMSFILTHLDEVQKKGTWGDLFQAAPDILCVVDGSGKAVDDKMEPCVLEFKAACMKEVVSLVAPGSPESLRGLELELRRNVQPQVMARRSLDPYTFRASSKMQLAQNGQQVSTTQGGSWARVDCPIKADASVQFAFEVLDDKAGDEGTCYGISTAGCDAYDKKGALALRSWNGRFHVNGCDAIQTDLKLKLGSVLSFKIDYSAGSVWAWLDEGEPETLVEDRSLFSGQTFYPTVFTYGKASAHRAVKLLYCNRMPSARYALQMCGDEGIQKGSVCVCKSGANIFASLSSWHSIGKISIGEEVVAAGRPSCSHGYLMLPIEPQGAVELRTLIEKVPETYQECMNLAAETKLGASEAATVALPSDAAVLSADPVDPESEADEELEELEAQESDNIPSAESQNVMSQAPATSGDIERSRSASSQSPGRTDIIPDKTVLGNGPPQPPTPACKETDDASPFTPRPSNAERNAQESPMDDEWKQVLSRQRRKRQQQSPATILQEASTVPLRNDACESQAESQDQAGPPSPKSLKVTSQPSTESVEGRAQPLQDDVEGCAQPLQDDVEATFMREGTDRLEAAVGAQDAEMAPMPTQRRSKKNVRIGSGDIFPVLLEGPIFASTTSDEITGQLSCGDEVVAAGPPEEFHSSSMLPIQPQGAVEMCLLASKPVQASVQEVPSTIFDVPSEADSAEKVASKRRRKNTRSKATVQENGDAHAHAVETSVPEVADAPETAPEGHIAVQQEAACSSHELCAGAQAAEAGSESELAIKVQTRMGKAVELKVPAVASVAALKTAVAEASRVPLAFVHLSFRGTALDESQCISDLGISDGAVILLTSAPTPEPQPAQPNFFVTVQTKLGKQTAVEVSADMSVGALRRSVAEKTCLPLPFVHLHFQGKALEDETSTVARNGIREEATLILGGRPGETETPVDVADPAQASACPLALP